MWLIKPLKSFSKPNPPYYGYSLILFSELPKNTSPLSKPTTPKNKSIVFWVALQMLSEKSSILEGKTVWTYQHTNCLDLAIR